MSRAQCIVISDNRLLMVKHRHAGEEWWCLLGGGINLGEAPDAAALRELKEECCVAGRLLRPTSVVEYGPDDRHFSYLVDIGHQSPQLGDDPEKKAGKKVLAGLAWLSFSELSEMDRAYLWTAGLLAVEPFASELLTWDRAPAAPKKWKPNQVLHNLTFRKMNPRFPTSGGGRSKAGQIYKAVGLELRTHFRAQSEKISALLFRHDPLKLSFGTNQDEYDAVAWAILAQLITTPSKEDVLSAVHRGFCQTFGADKTGPVSNYKVVAGEIWRVWRSLP